MNCPNCGQPVADGAPFCGNCGFAFTQTPEWETPEPGDGQFGRPKAAEPVDSSGFEYLPPLPSGGRVNAFTSASSVPNPAQTPSTAAPQTASQPSVSAIPNPSDAQTIQGSASSQPQIGTVPGTQTSIDFNQVLNNGEPPQKPPREKKNNSLIVGIVIGVVGAVVVGVIVFAIIGYFTHQEKAETTSSADAVTTQQGVTPAKDAASDETTASQTTASAGSDDAAGYMKGTVSDGEYANAWLNIRMSVPTGWTEDDASGYAEWEDEKTECGFSCTSPNHDSVAIVFYDADPGDTAEGFRDSYDASLKERSVKMKSDPVHTRVKLGGKRYLCSDVVFSDGTNEYAESTYFMLLDGKMVVIFIVGDTVDDNDAIMQTIRDY